MSVSNPIFGRHRRSVTARAPCLNDTYRQQRSLKGLGVDCSAIGHYKMPEPDAYIGKLEDGYPRPATSGTPIDPAVALDEDLEK